MAENNTSTHRPLTDLAPKWLRVLGVNGWLAMGFTGALIAVVWFFGQIASIAIPLAFAIMLGVVFAPLVDYLQRLRLPRVAGAVIALLVVVGVIGLAGWVTVSSVIDQWPTIEQQLQSAYAKLGAYATSFNIPQSLIDQVSSGVRSALPSVAQGAASIVTSGLSGTVSFVFGAFLGFYMLYLVLADYHKLSLWIGVHVGLPGDVGSGIVDDTSSSLRAYFRGSTIIGIANAAVIALGMWVLGVPLIMPVVIVTVILGYIPFFGALVSGVFAVLIALGANGVETALILLAVVLVAQNVVQMPIQSYVMGDALELHPIVVLVTTMIGSIFGGLLGGMLGAPLTAVVVRASKRIRVAARESAASSPEGEPEPEPASA